MRLLFNQGRLATRGAAEMVLNQVSACKGEAGDMIEKTLTLGIAILRGGNIEVQTVIKRALNRSANKNPILTVPNDFRPC